MVAAAPPVPPPATPVARSDNNARPGPLVSGTVAILVALVDQGPGRHEADLLALSPSHVELLAAARWALTHDPSEGFRQELEAALRHLGVEDADLGA